MPNGAILKIRGETTHPDSPPQNYALGSEFIIRLEAVAEDDHNISNLQSVRYTRTQFKGE
jgi:hypothetical protein